ncbi:MAG TPA: hypothetical protein RMG48_05090 [Myxococcales bacterium LLY-WYZ-16_1]|nr:hypothetical protein [Myxococcales bacterium LLY-WYZ-16_1]
MALLLAVEALGACDDDTIILEDGFPSGSMNELDCKSTLFEAVGLILVPSDETDPPDELVFDRVQTLELDSAPDEITVHTVPLETPLQIDAGLDVWVVVQAKFNRDEAEIGCMGGCVERISPSQGEFPGFMGRFFRPHGWTPLQSLAEGQVFNMDLLGQPGAD